MKYIPRMAFVVVAALLIPATSFATTINLGVLSFDTLIAGGSTAGANVFNISNLTGAANIPPDFPVADALTFLGASLKVVRSGGTSSTIPLGNIGLGGLSPTIPVEFPDSSLFSSAVFSSTLSQLSFLKLDKCSRAE